MYHVSKFAVIATILMPSIAYGQGLPTDEATDDIMKACAVGRQLGIEGDVRAALTKWFRGGEVGAELRVEDLGAILEKIRPDEVGVEFYRLYVECLEAQARIKADQLGLRDPVFTRTFSRIVEDLDAWEGNDFDLQKRLAAIHAISSLAYEDKPPTFIKNAVDILTTYIELNISDRKRQGPGIIHDRGTYLAKDIIAALKTLQQLQQASSGSVHVNLVNIDFSNTNLAPPGGLDLSYFRFHYSNFDHAFLSGCTCRYTEFNFATFDDAAIWNADFAGARFHKSNLQNSKWANVNLANTNIDEAADLNVALMDSPRGLTDYQQSIFR